MKLKPPSRFTSFYESFSDLIFATMAIFVLLMMIFLTLINIPENKKIEEKLKEQSEKIAKLESERDSSRKQLEQITKQLTKLEESVKANGLELVVAVDVTGSMADGIAHLLETITTISKVLPKITSDFKIGVIAYRQENIDKPPFTRFPLTKIFAEHKDRGKSFTEIYNFLFNLKAISGIALVDLAVKESLNMFSNDYSKSQIFVLLGDVGPYEDRYNITFEYAEKKNEKVINNRIANWINQSSKRRFISVFAGNRNRQDSRYNESLRFFREVSKQKKHKDNFTQNPSNMLPYILNAIVKEK